MKRIIIIMLFLNIHFIFAEPSNYTHYVNANLRLRENYNLSSTIITTLPKYTAIKIMGTGRSDCIDGMTAPWIKIISQTGYEGWCFSGYVETIEKNIVDKIAEDFIKREAGAYPGLYEYAGTDNIDKLETIRLAVGYYVQQTPRRFQGSGHAPEILKLFFENDNVYIAEIDIIEKKEVFRNKIKLEYNGKTYAYNKTKLLKKDDTVQIIYLENIPEKEWLGTWEYRDPYTFAGALNNKLSDTVLHLTSEYLRSFEGQYILDSSKVVISKNVDMNFSNQVIINIQYDQKEKCLSVSIHDLIDFYNINNRVGDYHLRFVETDPDKPFFWSYGEGVGFDEDRFFFYKGGIAFTYEYQGVIFNDKHEIVAEKKIKIVAFFEKKSTDL